MSGSHSPVRPVSTTGGWICPTCERRVTDYRHACVPVAICNCATSLAETVFKKLKENYDLLPREKQGRFDRWLSAHTSGHVTSMSAAHSWLALMGTEAMLDKFEMLLGEIFWIKYRNENEKTIFTN